MGKESRSKWPQVCTGMEAGIRTVSRERLSSQGRTT